MTIAFKTIIKGCSNKGFYTNKLVIYLLYCKRIKTDIAENH